MRGMHRLGLLLRSAGRGEDMVQARQWLLKAANAHNVSAMCALADMLRTGQGRPQALAPPVNSGWQPPKPMDWSLDKFTRSVPQKDLHAARVWLTKAAEAGDARGMHDLAQMFLKNEGGARRDFQCQKWLWKAVDSGHFNKEEMSELALKLECGVQGVPRQIFSALELAKRANNQAVISRVQPLLDHILSNRRTFIIILCLSRQRLLRKVMQRSCLSPHNVFGPSMTEFVAELVSFIGYNDSLWGRVCTFAFPLNLFRQPDPAVVTELMSRGYIKKKSVSGAVEKKVETLLGA